MIHIESFTNPFDRSSREAHELEWDLGATVRACCPERLVGRAGVVCSRNGEPVCEDDLDRTLRDGDRLSYMVRPQFTGGTTAVIKFLGATLFEISSLSAVGLAALQAGALVVNSLLISYALKALSPDGQKAALPDEQSDSPHGSFSGITANPDYEGAAYPAVAGRPRVAGAILNAYTRSTGAPTSTRLYMLMCVAGHRVESIGDKTADNSAPLERVIGVGASGNVTFTGTNGTTIPVGQQVQYVPSTLTYLTTETGDIASGSVTLAVSCETDGPAGDLSASSSLSVISPPSGCDSTATVASGGLTGGTTGVSLMDGLEINNQPADNFPRLNAYVRMGTASQATIPGHELPRIEHRVDRTLLPTQSPATSEVTLPGVYSPSSAEISKWDSSVAYTMGEEADDFIAIVSFQQGLYELNTNAQRDPLTIEFQARYRKVTAEGTAFGDYVVLPKFPVVTADVGVRFDIEMHGVFYDTESYVYTSSAGQGFSFDNSATTDYATLASMTFPGGHASGDDFTFASWMRIDYTVSASSGWTYTDPQRPVQTIFSQWSATQGFEVKLEEVDTVGQWQYGGSAVFQANRRTKLVLRVGDGTSEEEAGAIDVQNFFTQSGGTIGLSASNWGLFAIAFQHNAPDAPDPSTSPHKVTFFCNDSVVGTSFVAVDAQWKTSAATYLGNFDGAGGTRPFSGDLDEPSLYHRALTAVEVAALYNGGSGVQLNTSAAVDLVELWRADGTTSAEVVSPGNDLTLSGAGAGYTASGSGVVSVEGSANRLRGRYLVEMQRLTANNTGQHSQDEARWSRVLFSTYEPQNHAGLALLALDIEGSDQIGGSRPLATVPVSGYRPPIWDGADPDSPKLTETWTRNNAWLITGFAQDKLLGMGRLFPTNDRIDWESFYSAAAYCDERVWDLEASTKSDGTEANGVLQAFPMSRVTAASAGGSWPTGQVIFVVGPTEWRANWPQDSGGTVTAKEDAEYYFTIADPHSSAPQWVKDLEGVALPVGEISFVKAVYGSSPVPTSLQRWQIICHLPSDPATSDTYDSTVNEDSVVQHLERRFEFDHVFDRLDESGWDAMLKIARAARSVLALRGRKLTIFTDRDRDPAWMATDGNTLAGLTMQWTTPTGRTNLITSDIFDRLASFDKRPVVEMHPTAAAPSSSVHVVQRRTVLEGVTRRSQARRHLRHDLNRMHLSRRTVELSLAPDAVALEPGDVIQAAAELPSWGTSGRLLRNSPDGSRIFLDQAVTIVSGTSYEILWRNSTTGALETQAVSTSAGTYGAGEPITVSTAFASKPRAGDVYSFGETSKAAKSFIVVQTTFDPRTLQRTVVGLEHDPNVYDPSGFADYPSTPVSALPAPTTAALP